MDLVPESLYLSLLKNADLLISHESGKLRDMSVPSKLTNYRASAKPILVVCSPQSATYFEVLKYHLEHCAPDDPTLLANKIIKMSNNTHVTYSFILHEDYKQDRLRWAINNE